MTDVIPAIGEQYTVAELIEALQAMPPHLPVVVSVKMHPESAMTERGNADVVIDDGGLVIIGGPHAGYDDEDLDDEDDET